MQAEEHGQWGGEGGGGHVGSTGVGAEVVKGCGERNHSSKCCAEPACQGDKAGFSVTKG